MAYAAGKVMCVGENNDQKETTMNTTTNTARIDHIEELAHCVNAAACDLRWALQWKADDANVIAEMRRKFDSATSAFAAYADGVLDAARGVK